LVQAKGVASLAGIVCMTLSVAASAASAADRASAQSACSGTVYLTLDTGNMSQAERIADTLRRHDVRVTFFLANERTPRGDFSLDPAWAPYWRARVAEGHAFGSHTFDHVYFRGTARGGDGVERALVRPQFGDAAGRTLQWDAAAVCAELTRVDTRLRAIAGRGLDPVWRAPGGRAPGFVMRAAQACGYRHAHWAAAGFLGDELPSETHPNERLLAQALAGIRDGDILMAHLGIWSRKDPWAPMLDPLIAGLKRRGLCFATLNEHPEARR
jgi:peptidoglycan/xylan/chitin deacetylase (PgdA/CDA1 family)